MKKDFLEAVQLEDAIHALENGYYDTHDLDDIAQDEGVMRRRLAELRERFHMEKNEWFSDYQWDDHNGPVKVNVNLGKLFN